MRTWISIYGLLTMSYSTSNTVSALAILLLVAPQAARLAEQLAEDPEQPLPNLELLEFLGSFETNSGEWVDPIQFLEPEVGQFLDRTELQQKETPGTQQGQQAVEDQITNHDDE